MKKALLSVAAIAATVMTGWANEYTFVLDGNNDLGGLTRQTSNKEADLTFSDSFKLSDEGLDLTVSKQTENGLGFALINAGGTNAGLCVFSTFSIPQTPEIKVTAPGGNITSVTLTMSGSALSSLDIPFNNVTVEAVNENALFTWTWSDGDGAESVVCSWTNSFYPRYIHSIKVVYTPDLGGKQASGLKFPLSEYEAILGEKFTSPTLSNPNKLEVKWSSSDEAVASVDEKGKVTLNGRGTAVITAATAGNEKYAPGNAKYELTVIPSASNIEELLEYAPALYDRIKVNFPATVNFANASIAFVTDAEGNAACFDNIVNRNSTSTTVQTIYKVGEVIPAGWIAKNATIYESVIWEGKPGNVTETVTVTYPMVSSVTPADVNRVVILQNVTFTTRTAESTTKAYGTTPDGTRYEFQDTYEIPGMAPGTYDVTCVVRFSKRGNTEYFFLSPIGYSEATVPEPSLPAFPHELNVTVQNASASVWQGPLAEVNEKTTAALTEDELEFADMFHAEKAIVITGKVVDETIVADFDLPEGWLGVYPLKFKQMSMEDTFNRTRANDSEWVPLEEYIQSLSYMGWFEATMEGGKQLTFSTAEGKQIYYCYLYMHDDGTLSGDPEYAADFVDSANMFLLIVDVEKAGTGVNSLDKAGNAEYYNVNGTRVANPGKGLYIKVADGKAVKIVR